MIKTNKHIEIVSSSKTWLSSMSQESRDSALAALSQRYSRVGITLVDTLSDLEALVSLKPDLVFLGMKFVPLNPQVGRDDPNKVWLSQYLSARGIASTGSNYLAHELELNKHLAKQRVIDAGLQTSPFYVVPQTHMTPNHDSALSFPVFIKPTNRGGGMGIDSASVAYDEQQLGAKTRSLATTLHSDSLVEEYLPGREFSVAILKNNNTDRYTVMPIELATDADERGVRMLAGDVKSANAERVLPVVDSDLSSIVCELAINVFSALGARDYGRIDIRLDKRGMPQFLEANLIPSLIEDYGSFPKSCALNEDLGYEAMMFHIAELGLARQASVSKPILASPVLDTASLPFVVA